MNASVEAIVTDSTRLALLEYGDERLELEFRLGTIVGGKFVAGVSVAAFDRIRATLDASSSFRDVVDLETTESIVGDGKYVVDPSGRRDAKWNYKKRLKVLDIGDLGIVDSTWVVRAGISLESIEQGPPPSSPTPFQRRKSRRSYRYKCWSFDLTRVSSNLPDTLDSDDASYEVEIELVDTSVLFVRPLDNVVTWGLQLTRDLLTMTTRN
jgi:hypothetical protein